MLSRICDTVYFDIHEHITVIFGKVNMSHFTNTQGEAYIRVTQEENLSGISFTSSAVIDSLPGTQSVQSVNQNRSVAQSVSDIVGSSVQSAQGQDSVQPPSEQRSQGNSIFGQIDTQRVSTVGPGVQSAQGHDSVQPSEQRSLGNSLFDQIDTQRVSNTRSITEPVHSTDRPIMSASLSFPPTHMISANHLGPQRGPQVNQTWGTGANNLQQIPLFAANSSFGNNFGAFGPQPGFQQVQTQMGPQAQNPYVNQGMATPHLQSGLDPTMQNAMQNMFMQFLQSNSNIGAQNVTPSHSSTHPTAYSANSYESVQANSSTVHPSTFHGSEQMEIESEVTQEEGYISDPGFSVPQVGGSEPVVNENSYRKAMSLAFDTLPLELEQSDMVSDDSYTSVGEVKSKEAKPQDLFFPLANRAGYELSKTFSQVKAGIQLRVSKAGNLKTPVGIFPGPPKVPNRDYTNKTYHIHGCAWQHADKLRSSASWDKSKDKAKQPLTGLEPPPTYIPDQAILEWKSPPSSVTLNGPAAMRMDRAIRAHMGVANSTKFMDKASFTHITEAKGLMDALLLEDVPKVIEQKMAKLSRCIDNAHQLGEQLSRLADDNLTLATDQMVLWTMLQRDKWLSQLPKEVSMETLMELRTSDFPEGKLFPPLLVAKAADEVRSRQKEAITKAAHKRDADYLAAGASAPKKQKFQSSTGPVYSNPYRGKGGRGRGKTPNFPKSVAAAAAGSADQIATDAPSQAPVRGRGRGRGRGYNPYSYRGNRGRARGGQGR